MAAVENLMLTILYHAGIAVRGKVVKIAICIINELGVLNNQSE